LKALTYLSHVCETCCASSKVSTFSGESTDALLPTTHIQFFLQRNFPSFPEFSVATVLEFTQTRNQSHIRVFFAPRLCSFRNAVRIQSYLDSSAMLGYLSIASSLTPRFYFYLYFLSGIVRQKSSSVTLGKATKQRFEVAYFTRFLCQHSFKCELFRVPCTSD